jgi:hypothetical protein
MICYKSCLIVRKDFQNKFSIIFIYMSTFILRLFRVAIVLTIYFDLEIKSFDIINIFINTKHDLLVTRVIY